MVVGLGLRGGGEARAADVEGVAVFVARCAGWDVGSGHHVGLHDCVVLSVDLRVDAQTEEVLVQMRVDAGVDLYAPAMGVLAGVERVGIEDSCQFDFELHRAVQMERPVNTILVVGCGEDVRDDELAVASQQDRVVAEIGVFVKDARVFFVDADGFFDYLRIAGFVHKLGVHVVNRSCPAGQYSASRLSPADSK